MPNSGSCGLLLLAAAHGCSQAPSHAAQPQDPLAQILLKSAPVPQSQVNIGFGDKLMLLGFDLNPAPARAGEPLRMTWYWRVDAPLEQYRLVSQLSDGAAYRIDLAERPLARSYPEARWKPGDLIRDDQTIRLPLDWRSDVAVVYMAFDAGEERLRVAGFTDGAGRAEVVRVGVREGDQTASALPELDARAADAAPAIDGLLDEPLWRSALSTSEFVEPEHGGKAAFAARARFAYDAEHVYAAVVVMDDDLSSAPDADGIELLFDPAGDAKHLYALRVDANGGLQASLDGQDWQANAELRAHAEGSFDDTVPDRGYQIELALPRSGFGPAAASGALRAQVCADDRRGQTLRRAAWSAPLAADCRHAERFGRLALGAATDQVK